MKDPSSSSSSPPPPPPIKKAYNISEASHLLNDASTLLSSSFSVLYEAREIAEKRGLSVDSCILDASYQSPFLPSYFQKYIQNSAAATTASGDNSSVLRVSGSAALTRSSSNTTTNTTTTCTTPNHSNSPSFLNNNHHNHNNNAILPTILATTGGHSNVDHIIQYTGNYKYDTIAEYKRKLKRRMRNIQPEQRGVERWDQPRRIAGSRRRRIVRDSDLPCAPPEPPPSGYVVYISQMTTKIRHDKPNEHHNQVKVVREISKIWRYGMSNEDRKYYNDFCKEFRKEYETQYAEYRATGSFRPSILFERLHGSGPWVRKAYHDKNSLEREISSYETVKFPERPEHMPKPEWLKKVEKAKEREMERRKEREERAKKRRLKERLALEEANREKVKRLKNRL